MYMKNLIKKWSNMMKHTKRAASLLLVLILSLAMLTVPAGATMEGELPGGTITINNAYKGETYKAYQILYLESYDSTAGAYSYKANSAWESWLRTQTSYVSVDDQGYVTWNENADEAAFAKAALQYAQTANGGVGISADKTVKADAPKEDDPVNAKTNVMITDLKLGYYLVDSSLGAICSLDTTDPDATINDKNMVPTLEKEVQEDSKKSESGGDYGASNDADIGQEVTFQTTITAKAGARNYVLHDTMSEGLTFIGVEIVMYESTPLTAGDDYTVVTSTSEGSLTLKDSTCTFEIYFSQDFLNTLNTGDQILVTYTAKLNENAVIGDTGNTNNTKLTFGDNNETTWDETRTYTWEFDVLKYGNGDKNKHLSGAKFVLLNSGKDKVATIVGGKLTEWVNVPEKNTDGTIAWPTNTEMTTDNEGKIQIAGLDADTYYLRETQQPAGYNKLTEDQEVKIEPHAENDGLTMILEPVTVGVNNQSGSLLPSTGGMGTTVLYVLGGALMLGAAVLLVTKKRLGRAGK